MEKQILNYYKKIFKSIKFEFICYICLLTVIPLLFVCVVEYYGNKKAVETRVMKQLTSVADLKKIELNNWLQERLKDTSLIARNKILAAAITQLFQQRRKFSNVDEMLNTKSGRALYKMILGNLHILQQFYKHYNIISIVDGTNGEIVLSTYPDIVGKKLKSFSSYLNILNEKEAAVKDIHTSELLGQNYMTYFCPVCMTNPESFWSNNIIIGIILLDINVKNSIEPLISNRSGMGNTGETLLVRKEGKNIVYLNNLRHKQETALKFISPVDSTPDTPAVLSSNGKEGFMRSADYRGVQVLSAYRHIPALKWGLVAKQDVSEAFAQIIKLKIRTLILIGICTVIIVIIGISFTNRITRPILRLAQGAKAIGSGNLDHRISINSQNEVGLLAREFNQMAAKLKASHTDLEQKVEERTAQLLQAERLAAVGQLAAEVAHEINNPLGGMQNYANMLQNEPQNISQTKSYASFIQEGLKRIEIIVKRLLTFSKPYSLNMAPEDVNTILNNSVDFIEHKIEVSHIQIKKHFNEQLPPVFVDADHISQVFINIMINAIESMPNGGVLTLTTDTCKRHNKCITISIRDTGGGIREDIKNKIFAPFFTTKNKEGEQGLGMGLAVSKRIVDDHHGYLRLENTNNEGSTFSLCLPIPNE